MSAPQPSVETTPGPAVVVRCAPSPEFARLLHGLEASLLISTGLSGKLVVVTADANGELSVTASDWDRPLGVAAEGPRLAVAIRNQVWFLADDEGIARQLSRPGRHDGCFLPRWGHVTGAIQARDLAWAGEELWIVNARFSCLCTLQPEFSFVPRWRPAFISALAGEDRCHLNGLAVAPGARDQVVPRYVTALGETDTPQGWRAAAAEGGCLIDVPADRTVVRGLSLPCCPRWYQDRIWLLESGRQRLLMADPSTGRVEPVAEVPGFPRGLDFAGDLAFIGISPVHGAFQQLQLPIAESPKGPRSACGVSVVDVRRRQTVTVLEFASGVEEVVSVVLLRGKRSAVVLAPQDDAQRGIFVLPTA